MEQISGIIEEVHHKNGRGFIIFTVRRGRELIRVTGEDQDLYEADVVDCEGVWSEYKGQTQFKASKIIPQIPSTADAMWQFITSGRVKGISEVLGGRLIEAFGKDLIYVIENEPAKLKKVPGFGPSRIKQLIDGIRDQIGYRSILIFLNGFGLGKYHTKKIYDVYSFNAVEKIKANPYRLCQDVPGIGFITADRIGMQMGLEAEHPDRLVAGAMHALQKRVNKTGSTGIVRAELVTETVQLLSEHGVVRPEKLEEGIDGLLASKLAMELIVDEVMYIFPAELYRAEEGIAKHLKRLMSLQITADVDDGALTELVLEAEKIVGKDLSENQRKAVKMALLMPISTITGGPGTGKTTIMRVFLECCKLGMGMTEDDMLLCAPTGKAAKRLSQSSGQEAMTVHRALEFNPQNDGFNYNADNPLPVKIVVCDEFSMMDTMVTYWLVQAIATGTRFVMAGDVNQLASVGPGRVLEDIIMSNWIAVQYLTDIYRTSPNSMIAVNAAEMNKGNMPALNTDKDSDFWFLRTESDEATANMILDLIDRLHERYGFDKFDDIQVLTPMRKGAVGIYELNNRLQKKLNSANLGKGIKVKQDDINVEFCLADKVMHIENNKQLGVLNGEVGRVVLLNKPARELTVEYEDRKVVYAYADLEQLRLNYAQTIHKSQGSEYRCVLIPCSMGHFNMLYRSLMYTGTTRAKQFMVFVGAVKALKIAVERVSSDQRVTGLRSRLKKMAA